MHLAKETNHSLARSGKQKNEIAVRKIINERKINIILYLVFIVFLVSSFQLKVLTLQPRRKINMIHKR